jgi:hypothetical protein
MTVGNTPLSEKMRLKAVNTYCLQIHSPVNFLLFHVNKLVKLFQPVHCYMYINYFLKTFDLKVIL